MTDTPPAPQDVQGAAARPADGPAGRPSPQETGEGTCVAQRGVQPVAADGGAPAPEPCENCDAADGSSCGCCPVCDTTGVEHCVACGKCRCDRHDDCVRPPADEEEGRARPPAAGGAGTPSLFAGAGAEPFVVRSTAVVLARVHQAAAYNEYGSCVAPGFRVVLGSRGQARVHHELPPIDLTDPNALSSSERRVEQRARVGEYATTLRADGFDVVRREALTSPILLATLPAEAFPCRIALFCDRCGHTAMREYLVDAGMTKAQRLQVARDHLTASEGWSCGPDEDVCSRCAPTACTLCEVVKPGAYALRDHVLNVHADEFCRLYHAQPCAQAARTEVYLRAQAEGSGGR